MSVAALNSAAVAWQTLVIAVLWQSTVVAFVVGCVAWLLRRASPALRYWLWQIVAIKLLLAPLWSVALPLPWLPNLSGSEPLRAAQMNSVGENLATVPQNAALASFDAGVGAMSSAAGSNHSPPKSTEAPLTSSPTLTWQAWLMLSWGIIVAALAIRIALQGRRLSQVLARAEIAKPALVELVARTAKSIGLPHPPRALVTATDCSPFVCGVRRPALVLPQSLVLHLSEEHITSVLVHELAHLRRHDLVWGWIPQIVRTLYFFHPVSHYVAFRVRLEAELACDATAMSSTGRGASAYADLLVNIVGRLSDPAILHSGSAASAGFAGQSPHVQEK